MLSSIGQRRMKKLVWDALAYFAPFSVTKKKEISSIGTSTPGHLDVFAGCNLEKDKSF
jgi:hypothetical protein